MNIYEGLNDITNYIDLGNTEVVVLALAGAVLNGLGTGIVFKEGFTTGGSDVLKQILSEYGKMPLGKATLYVEGIIVEDIPRVAPSTDISKISRFMRSLARNESTTASRNTVRKDLNGEISDDTANNYMGILTRLFQIDDILPYSPSVRSSLRVKQMPKHHYVDPSIPAALLRLNVKSLMNDLETFGFLFESLVLRDLQIYSAVNGFNLYHYQDYRDNEVDAVVEADDGAFGLIEIKLGTGDIEKGIKTLTKTNKALIETSGQGASFLCVISGLTPYAYKDPSGVIIVPLTALKP